MDEKACQQGVHTKAFTGKGPKDRALRQAQLHVDKLHARQRELSDATRHITARMFYLTVHSRASTGQRTLRWRSAGSSRTTHLAWNAMAALFQQVPTQLADWYRAANRLARDLNQEEQNARLQLRQMQCDVEASGLA